MAIWTIQIGWYTLDQDTIFRHCYGANGCYEIVRCLAGKYAAYARSYQGEAQCNTIWADIPGIVVEDNDGTKNTGRISGHRIEATFDRVAEAVSTRKVYNSGRWELLPNFESHCTKREKGLSWSIAQTAKEEEISESGYGLYLNSEETGEFCRAYAVTHGLATSEVPLHTTCRCGDLRRKNWFWISRIQHFDGKPHEEDGNEHCGGMVLYIDSLSCNGVQSFPYLLSGERYPGLREMAMECRRLYGNYLPEDFDYPTHMAFFVGTYRPDWM